MTKAELNAHQALPDETLRDSYTITHKREREAFVRGWHKAVELCCEWLKKDMFNLYDKYEKINYVCSGTCNNKDEFIKNFKKAMNEDEYPS